MHFGIYCIRPKGLVPFCLNNVKQLKQAAQVYKVKGLYKKEVKVSLNGRNSSSGPG